MKAASSYADRQMDMMRPVVVIHFAQSPRMVSENWAFLCIVIREVFWIEQRISKTGSLSYFRYRGEEMCWSSVNEISQTWLLTWGRKVSNFRNSAVCLECHTVEVQNSVTWSVIIPLSELFRKCASVTFRGPMADAVRWYHVLIPCQSQFK
jgi:hypothetical protein